MSLSRRFVAGVVGTLVVSGVAAPAWASSPPTTGAGGPAPGAPGIHEQYLPATKSGVGTSTTTASPVWLTVQKTGGLGGGFYPPPPAPPPPPPQVAAPRPHRGPP